MKIPDNRYHLAQINVARMLAPIDSEIMAGFVAQLAAINALADSSPGFVWRLQTEGGNATSVHAYEDPFVIVNMSVWQGVEALRAFTYESGHVGLLRARTQWFERPTTVHFAMWWVPAGHIPTIEEATERLGYLGAHGASPVAFTFRNPFDPPPAVAAHGDTRTEGLAPVRGPAVAANNRAVSVRERFCHLHGEATMDQV